MDKNLTSYAKVYHNFISKDICETTVNELEAFAKDNWHKHSFYNPITKSHVYKSGDNELDYSYLNFSTKDVIMKLVWEGFVKYLSDIDFEWMNGFAGYSEIRMNKYSENQLMALHCDNIHSLFDGTIKGVPIMSFVGVLNDNYEGGEFVMWEDQVIELKQGSIFVFPSNYLYPHTINPIKKGTRYSFVSWAY
jgi:hypothetical protein